MPTHETVTVELFFEAPFFECLRREAERNYEGDVDQMVKEWVWWHYDDILRTRYHDLSVDVEIEIPADLYESAELRAKMKPAKDFEWQVEEYLFDYIDWNTEFKRVDE